MRVQNDSCIYIYECEEGTLWIVHVRKHAVLVMTTVKSAGDIILQRVICQSAIG